MYRHLLEAAVAIDPTSASAPPGVEKAEKAESYNALAVLTLMLLLGAALMLGQVLERNKVEWLSEAGGALLIGVLLGLLVMVTNLDDSYSDLVQFNVSFFFIFLLPPIIFDAGFSLDVVPFTRNLGAISALAFVGTAVSALIIALVMWLAGAAHLSYPISFFAASLFGAMISATDPVTVLAVFGRLHADRDLNALVFGESVLNDAVAIVLYEVISHFGPPESRAVTAGSVALGIWQFTYIFAASLAIGVIFALAAAAIFRSRYFRNDHAPVEAGLVIIIAYCSFYVTDGIGLSGITSIMFCGLVMAKYVRPNLSRDTDDRVYAFFRVIASLAEIFVFIYIGAALFTERSAWRYNLTWAFVAVSIPALAVSRYANVFPCVALVNALRPPEAKIPRAHTRMLWFSGLRGAMAYALANLAHRDKLPGADGAVILTATLFLVVVTVLVNGGASPYLITRWRLSDSELVPGPRSPQPLEFSRLAAEDSEAPHSADLRYSSLAMESGRPENGSSPAIPLSTKMIDSIHDFQRQGGITRQFEHLDRLVSSYLIQPQGQTDAASEACPIGDSLHARPAEARSDVQQDEQ